MGRSHRRWLSSVPPRSMLTLLSLSRRVCALARRAARRAPHSATPRRRGRMLCFGLASMCVPSPPTIEVSRRSEQPGVSGARGTLLESGPHVWLQSTCRQGAGACCGRITLVDCAGSERKEDNACAPLCLHCLNTMQRFPFCASAARLSIAGAERGCLAHCCGGVVGLGKWVGIGVCACCGSGRRGGGGGGVHIWV